MGKKNLMIYIEEDVIKKSKDLGLNISKVSENALKEMIRRIENLNIQNDVKNCSESKREGSMVGRTGFEPATFCTSSRCPNQTRRPALQPF